MMPSQRSSGAGHLALNTTICLMRHACYLHFPSLSLCDCAHRGSLALLILLDLVKLDIACTECMQLDTSARSILSTAEPNRLAKCSSYGTRSLYIVDDFSYHDYGSKLVILAAVAHQHGWNDLPRQVLHHHLLAS